MKTIEIAPSILSADFGYLIQEVKQVDDLVNFIHIDVMDGHFVPNLTIGPVVSNALKRESSISSSLGIHLMITDPLEFAPMFDFDNQDTIIFHWETEDNPVQTIKELRDLNVNVGISLNPDTEPEPVLDLIPKVDEILVMSVYPGFGGQEFISDSLEKIELFREETERQNFSTGIAVDGGINAQTASDAAGAGASKLVAGSAIFGQNNRPQAIKELKKAARDR